MSFNKFDAINKIYNLKGQWTNANNAGDSTRANEIAKSAQEYYKQLSDNGYGDIANELSQKNYQQAKHTNDYYGKYANTEFRPYMYSLGKKMNLKQSDIDKLIKWDDTTGEIAFGGKKIGKPNAVVDGASYFNDTSVLDSAFDDYVKRNGITRSTDNMVNQENESLFKRYADEYDYLTQTNPFETDTAKSILERYDLKGIQGRDNAVTDGSSNNGGNIDSFASANAMRQQAALRNMGEQTALAAHNQRLQNAQTLLSNMGINISRVFEDGETYKNNELARETQRHQNSLEEAKVFGEANSNKFTNPYIGKDMDFKSAYDNAKANGASDEVLNQIAEARFMKQMNSGERDTFETNGFIGFIPTSKKTADYLLSDKELDIRKYLTDEQIKSAERLSNGDNSTQLTISKDANQNELDKINAQKEAEKEIIRETKNQSGMIDEKSIKSMDTVINNINNMYKSNTVGKEENDNIIINDGNGNYRINPKVDRASYLDLIISNLLSSNAIDENMMGHVLQTLNISSDDVLRVKNYMPKKQ